MRGEHHGMSREDAPEAPATPATLTPLSLAAASTVSGVSVPTLRKHLNTGALPGSKVEGGPHGVAWAIDPAALAAFVGERYGRPIDLAGLPSAPPASVPRKQAETESAAELRVRLEETLLELGRYRALAEASADADTRVEQILSTRIAELQAERDAAQAKADEAAAALERVRARGFFARVFGGSG